MGRKRISSKVRWVKALESAPALSVRQPWAWLIVNGYKDVENRSWPTHHRGPLLIHAGSNTSELPRRSEIERQHGIKVPEGIELGGIIGVVNLIDCKARTDSPWHNRGSIGWVLAKPRRLPFRACKGNLGLFRPKLLP